MAENLEQQEEKNTWKVPLLFLGFGAVGFVIAVVVLMTSTSQPTAVEPDTIRPARVQSGRGTIIGWEVPDFSLETLEGETVSLSDYRGKIVFLNFWATWCEPCQREMPVFEEFMASGRDDAVILAVNNGEGIQEVQSFVNLFGLEALPILLDEDFTVSDGFGIMNLPVTYVIDENGVVHNFKLGEVTPEDIDAYIRAIQS